jgi:NAD(P)-dependent dehydrogenase (short-subunit alcohol dehydrogenase family)
VSNQRWTAARVPDQAGKVAVITGANTGLGFETAKVLAARGASVVLAVRDVDKGKQAATKIAEATPGADVSVQQLDLSALDSVRIAAEELNATYDKIDLLINNAGVMYTPRIRTADGFELQFATNHLGHFALTGLLLDRLLAARNSRVVSVSSIGHRIRARINFDDLQSERGYSRVAAYGQSKLANLMFIYELQRRLARTSMTIAAAAHPGTSSTELVRNSPALLRTVFNAVGPLIMQSAAMGALPVLRAATDPGVTGGQYYGPQGFRETRGHPVVVKSSADSHDVEVQQRLWTVSEDLAGVRYAL